MQEKTTRFELNYIGDMSKRSMRLASKAPPIGIEDLPSSMQTKALHLAPIADEISYEVAEKLEKYADVVSLDSQGLVRVFDENGFVANGP